MKYQSLDLTPHQLRELQLKSLEIFEYFKDFCKTYNLFFCMCGGCCIGALRNAGFIPWDDDVDVFMPREDYEKFHALWKKYNKNSHLTCLKTDKNTFSGNIFTTIVDTSTTLIRPPQKDLKNIPKGVALDIFPLDGCPKNRFKRSMQKFWSMVYSLYLAQVIPQNHGKLFKFMGNILLDLVPSKKLRYKIWSFSEKQMSKYKIKDCDYITELCAGPHYMQNEYPKQIFKDVIYKKFENTQIPLPIGYDEYLKIAFGDYMTPPPKEKQKPHHDIIFLDLNKGEKL